MNAIIQTQQKLAAMPGITVDAGQLDQHQYLTFMLGGKAATTIIPRGL